MKRFLAVVLLGPGLGCATDAGTPASPPLLSEAEAPPGFPVGKVADTAPAGNALTEARAQLGKRLFFDKTLSRTREVACGTCHEQKHAFADPRAVSTGVAGRKGKRNAPALANLAWNLSFFWDGRVEHLEEQVGKPIEDPLEMDLPLAEAVARVTDDEAYRASFAAAYGGPPTEVALRNALASFVRTIVSGNSRYDRFLRGDTEALSARERQGIEIFMGDKGGCFHCHPPGPLTNEGFFNNGSFDEGGDVGRMTVTGRSGDLGKFKVPGLRNIAVSAPYMHDGSVATLAAVVAQYTRGGRGHPSTDPQIVPLLLNADEQAALVAFLHALTDEAFLLDPRYRP